MAREIYYLDVISADVAREYLQAFNFDHVYTKSELKFGPKWDGKVLIIVKTMYVQKSSDGMCHLKLVDNLRNMGFRPFQTDSDLWLLPWVDCYEYIAVVTDDLLPLKR